MLIPFNSPQIVKLIYQALSIISEKEMKYYIFLFKYWIILIRLRRLYFISPV